MAKNGDAQEDERMVVTITITKSDELPGKTEMYLTVGLGDNSEIKIGI